MTNAYKSHIFSLAVFITVIMLNVGCSDSGHPGISESLGEKPSSLQVIQTSPDNDATNIDLDISIQATFNTSTDSTTINNNTFIVRQDTSPVSGSFFFTDSSVTFDPAGKFQRNTRISTIISSEVADINGNIMDQDFEWDFTTRQATTEEITPPLVTSTKPSPGTTDVSADITIHAHFNKALNPSTVNNNTFLLRANNNSISGSVSYEDSIPTFNPSERLPDGTSFTATITDGIQDLYGNTPTNDYSWNFITKNVDHTPPHVISTKPRDNENNVPVDIHITAKFTESMNASTINEDTFELYQWRWGQYRKLSGSVNYSGTTATFTPRNDLRDERYYVVIISSDVTDLSGNAIGETYRWDFETEDD